jgi:hypothetical protein
MPNAFRESANCGVAAAGLQTAAGPQRLGEQKIRAQKGVWCNWKKGVQ